jgi:hypothetical protein
MLHIIIQLFFMKACIYMYIYIYVFIFVCICIYVYVYIYTYVYLWTFMYLFCFQLSTLPSFFFSRTGKSDMICLEQIFLFKYNFSLSTLLCWFFFEGVSRTFWKLSYLVWNSCSNLDPAKWLFSIALWTFVMMMFI